ncbi:MAG: trehalose-6-phosphate synthase [Limisphaerales bacterium]
MRLVVVSNRLPFTVSFQNGAPQFKPSAGGLTTGLWSYLDRKTQSGTNQMDYLWMGWPGAGVPPEHEAAVRAYGEQHFKSSPVFLPEESMDRFYLGFCNKTIWPLFHYFPMLTQYEEENWQEYRNINRVFAESVLAALRPDDVLWIHDYHLMLLPKMVREKFPEMPIGFFLHIPFPSWEIFRMLPRVWREEIIEGLLGSSLIGFHTHDYARDFLTSVLRTSGYEHQLGNLTLRDRVIDVDTFPMGVEFDRFEQAAKSKETQLHVEELRQKCVGQKVIFSVDRLDYTKGLINRLRGYEMFLKNNPLWHGKVVFIISVAPSRIGVDSYQNMKLELEQTVGRIVGDFGNVHWDAPDLPVPQPGVRGNRAALPVVRRGAHHAVARRHEPGGKGIYRLAPRSDRRFNPERNGRRGERDGRSNHHQSVSSRRFFQGARTGVDHAGRGTDPAQSIAAGTTAPLQRCPLGGRFCAGAAGYAEN